MFKERKAERETRGVKSDREEQSTAAVLDSAFSLLQSQPGPCSAGDPGQQHKLRTGRSVKLSYLEGFHFPFSRLKQHDHEEHDQNMRKCSSFVPVVKVSLGGVAVAQRGERDWKVSCAVPGGGQCCRGEHRDPWCYRGYVSVEHC